MVSWVRIFIANGAPGVQVKSCGLAQCAGRGVWARRERKELFDTHSRSKFSDMTEGLGIPEHLMVATVQAMAAFVDLYSAKLAGGPKKAAPS